jgi:AraC-like DNA-binding protein
MNLFQNILLICSVFVGTYSSLVLLFFSNHNRLLNRLLALFTLPVTLFFLLVYFRNNHVGSNYLVLVYTFLPLLYIAPAGYYMYLRALVRDDVRLSPKDLLHALPLLLHLLYMSPLVFSLLSGQLEWRSVLEGADRQTLIYPYGPIAPVYHNVFRLALMFVYLFLSFKLIFSKAYSTFIKQNKAVYPLAIRWVRYYSVFAILFGVFTVLSKSNSFLDKETVMHQLGDWVSIVILVAFNLMMLYAAFNPVILFGMPHFAANRLRKAGQLPRNPHAANFGGLPQTPLTPAAYTPTPMEQSVETAVNTYRRVELDKPLPEAEQETDAEEGESEAMQALVKRIEDHITAQQPFRSSEFNLQTLSSDLGVPQHHLAYLFKEVLKRSFVQYRTELRVNYVIDALRSGKSKQLNLKAIGHEAGFQSKSTFYRDFKIHTGKTPQQYLWELEGS